MQALTCLASNGSFQLSFRGWTTSPIPFNVTSAELYQFLQADRNNPLKASVINAITVSSWGGSGGLCANNTAILTFTQPVYGFEGIQTSANVSTVELLTVTSLSLSVSGNASLAELFVSPVQQQILQNASDPQEVRLINPPFTFELLRNSINSI